MKILYCGPQSPLVNFLEKENSVVRVEDKISPEYVANFDVTISYGYRHIFKKSHLTIPAINLHISFLPWNRGADPNLWSFFENSPKGVTIHHIDEGIDTGPIIAQKFVSFTQDEDTLRKTYERLQKEVESLFIELWPRLLDMPRFNQRKNNYFHLSKDKSPYLHLLTEGWDTKVSELRQLYEEAQKRIKD